MKSFVLLLAGGLVATICQGSSGKRTEDSIAQVLRQTYVSLFYEAIKNDGVEKWEFEKAAEMAREVDSESPFPEMIQCLMEYVEGNYPRSLFLLSEAEGKLDESQKQKYDSDDNGSNTPTFSINAHLSYRKFKIFSKMGRKEEACRERGFFIEQNRFPYLGLNDRSWEMVQYFPEISNQVRDLCNMGRFEETQALVDKLEREILRLEDDGEAELGKVFLVLSKSHLHYYQSQKPEEKLKFLDAQSKELSHPSITSEMAWAATLLGKEGEFSIPFFKDLAKNPRKSSTRLYPWELGKIAFANADWREALKQFETSWVHIDQKNRPYRQIATHKLRKTLAQALVEWGYPYRACGVLDRILQSPPRWSGTGDSLDRWMNELYLTGILAIEDCHMMEGAIDERHTLASLNTGDSANEKIAFHHWLKESAAARYGRKFLWSQAVRSNIAKELAREDGRFVRDAFHLSGARPWMWHVFIKVMGPRRTEMLMDKFPLMGVRGDLYNDFAKAEIAFLLEDWSAVKEHATLARKNLPEAKAFLNIRMGGLLLKACKELKLDPPEDGIEEVIRTLHPILLQRLGLSQQSQGSSGKEELLSVFRTSSISSKDIDFLLGAKKRTQKANP